MCVRSAAASDQEGLIMNSSIKVSVFILLLLLASYAVPADAATYYFGGAKKQLSTATSEVAAGYYDATTLYAVDPSFEAGNIKNTVNIFGIVGTYEGAGGTNYGLPKTGQRPGYPSGTPFLAGDDCSYASPEASDIGYPRGTGSWTAYNAARFTNNGNGTITDNATGLMWVQDGTGIGCNNGGNLTWEAAIAFCENLTFAGYEDWRLPNIKELQSIVDYGKLNPSMDATYFLNFQQYDDCFYSSTTFASGTGSAWYVYFYNGYMSEAQKDNNLFNVRPVRGGL